MGGEAIDGTSTPVVCLDSTVDTSTSSTAARESSPREAVTPDSGSTRAESNGLPSTGLELRVRGIVYKYNPLTCHEKLTNCSVDVYFPLIYVMSTLNLIY